MKAVLRAKRRKEREANGEGEEAEREEEDHEDDNEALKQATRKTGYTMCVRAGLGECCQRTGIYLIGCKLCQADLTMSQYLPVSLSNNFLVTITIK